MESEEDTSRYPNGSGAAPSELSHGEKEEKQHSATNPPLANFRNPFEGRTTHFADDLWTFVSIITYLADVLTDVLVCVKYYRDNNIQWFGLTLSFVAVASFAMQLFSTKWLLEDGKRQSCFTYVLHLLQLGPVWR